MFAIVASPHFQLSIVNILSHYLAFVNTFWYQNCGIGECARWLACAFLQLLVCLFVYAGFRCGNVDVTEVIHRVHAEKFAHVYHFGNRAYVDVNTV